MPISCTLPTRPFSTRSSSLAVCALIGESRLPNG
jgi:hypothetical protein